MSEYSNRSSVTVFPDQVRLLYRAAPEAFAATVLNALLLVYIEQEVIDTTLVYIWFSYMALIVVLRSGLVYRYLHTDGTQVSAETWNRLYVIGVALSAGGWGIAGVLLYPSESLSHQMFLIFVLGGMAAGAVVALAPRLEVFLVFLFPTLLPVIGRFLLQHDMMQRVIGVLLLVYMLATVVSAWRLHGTIKSSLILRHENVDLLQQLRSLSLSLNRAQHEERKHLATNLHDNLAQTLALCKMKVHVITRKAQVEPWVTSLSEIAALVEESLTYTRRVMSDLRPPLFGDQGDLGNAIGWVVEKIHRHGLRITVEDDGQAKPLNDEELTLVYQAVQELLYNVIKHANTNHATVCMRRINHMLQVSVTDNGAGFQCPPNCQRPTGEGFGLLNIRERVREVGGHFKIDSLPGSGTSATVTVPLKAEMRASAVRSETHPDSLLASDGEWVETNLIRVMLVEDQEMIREGLRTIINGQDDLRVVAEAWDGSMAVTRANECQPDVILMDINIPTLNGVEATRRIKAKHPGISVIGLSVHEDDRMAFAMRDAGASAYLSKGGSCEALCNIIRETVTEQRCR